MSLEMEEFLEEARVKRDIELAGERQYTLEKLPTDVRQRLLATMKQDGDARISSIHTLKRVAGRAGVCHADLED